MEPMTTASLVSLMGLLTVIAIWYWWGRKAVSTTPTQATPAPQPEAPKAS
jgi:hypothetical protein